MSSPAPLLKPPVPGANRNKPPRLTVGIPLSPSVKPVNPTGSTPVPEVSLAPRSSSRPAPPQLRLATPMGSQGMPHEGGSLYNGRPPPQPLGSVSSGTTTDSG